MHELFEATVWQPEPYGWAHGVLTALKVPPRPNAWQSPMSGLASLVWHTGASARGQPEGSAGDDDAGGTLVVDGRSGVGGFGVV